RKPENKSHTFHARSPFSSLEMAHQVSWSIASPASSRGQPGTNGIRKSTAPTTTRETPRSHLPREIEPSEGGDEGFSPFPGFEAFAGTACPSDWPTAAAPPTGTAKMDVFDTTKGVRAR